MKTYFLNSKKCLTCSFLFVASLAISSPTFASQKPRADDLKKELQTYLDSKKGAPFDEVLRRWEKQYGAQAVSPLLEIVENTKATDPNRYVALMGVGRLSGKAASPIAVKFLKDSSWMIRNGALELLQILDARDFGHEALPLLKDRALVVRMKAIDAIQKLRPAGSKEALLEAVFRQENYHRGKAQWVPQRALLALRDFPVEMKELAPMEKLLNPKKDAELTLHAIALLEKVSKRKSPTPSLKDQAEYWKKHLGK